jgi:hypothetical protein
MSAPQFSIGMIETCQRTVGRARESGRFISKVNCGGRILTLAKDLPDHILPFVTKRFIALKRPYAHYRMRAD